MPLSPLELLSGDSRGGRPAAGKILAVEAVKFGVEMLVNQKREPTTPDGHEDNSLGQGAGSSNSTRHTSGYATAVGIRECRKSSAGHQVWDLGETTSYRSGRVALFQNAFVPSSSPEIYIKENDA